MTDDIAQSQAVKVSFTRGDELCREERQIPAELYNRIHLLFSRADVKNLFIPIRSMQYLAVVDVEEIVFVDGQGPRNIELSWREFRVGDRGDLVSPVAYQCIFYTEGSRRIMNRLQSEFFKALEMLEQRQPGVGGSASVTPIRRGD